MIALEDIRTDSGLDRCLRLRLQAQALLDRLMKNRTRTELYEKEHGTKDPMRVVTGRTAIDNAIEHTRGILRDLDRVLNTEPGEKFETTCSGLSRLRARS